MSRPYADWIVGKTFVRIGATRWKFRVDEVDGATIWATVVESAAGAGTTVKTTLKQFDEGYRKGEIVSTELLAEGDLD